MFCYIGRPFSVHHDDHNLYDGDDVDDADQQAQLSSPSGEQLGDGGWSALTLLSLPGDSYHDDGDNGDNDDNDDNGDNCDDHYDDADDDV